MKRERERDLLEIEIARRCGSVEDAPAAHPCYPSIKGAQKMMTSQKGKDAADAALAAFLQDDEEGTQQSAAFEEGATQEVGFNG